MSRLREPASFPPGTRVQFSAEGRELLKPHIDLNGKVLRTEAGLIVVRERGGTVAEYHPDFLERR